MVQTAIAQGICDPKREPPRRGRGEDHGGKNPRFTASGAGLDSRKWSGAIGPEILHPGCSCDSYEGRRVVQVMRKIAGPRPAIIGQDGLCRA